MKRDERNMVNAVLEKVHNIESSNNNRYKVQTFNKIAKIGLDQLDSNTFETSEECNDPDAYLLRSMSLHEKTFEKSLKAIGRAGAGVNNIPVSNCTKSGIVVFNAPGANANAVKELVLTAMLIASRDILGGIDFVKSLTGNQEEVTKQVEKNKSNFKGIELKGKRLGVIGLGAIGLQVSNAGLSLGMDVQGYDPFISVNAAWELSSNVKRAASLESLIRNSDFISVHVPYSENTKGFITKERIQMMKRRRCVD